MTQVPPVKVEEFLALFDYDVAAARAALDTHTPPQSVVTPDHPRTSSGKTIVALDAVSRTYALGKKSVSALSDITLSVKEGEFIAITGASGSGKSTLLQIIGCMDKPSSGDVTVTGQSVAKLRDSQLSLLRQRTVGFVFQSFYLQPFLTLEDNIALPAMFTREKTAATYARVHTLLAQVGLTERAKHYPSELSGGQIQRAAIARALINSPRIILADEPTGNLDSASSAAIIDVFHSIRRQLGTTIILVTHDQALARKADRIITLKDGRLL